MGHPWARVLNYRLRPDQTINPDMPDVKKVVGIHRPEAQKAPEMSEMTEDR